MFGVWYGESMTPGFESVYQAGMCRFLIQLVAGRLDYTHDDYESPAEPVADRQK